MPLSYSEAVEKEQTKHNF